MIDFSFIYSEIYIAIILLAFIFFLLKKVDVHTLGSIVIIILLSYISYIYIQTSYENQNNTDLSMKKLLDKDIQERKEKNDKSFYIQKFPKKLTYLHQNDTLMNIMYNIRFVKTFSNARYGNLLVNINSLMKIYIYILSERYTTDNISIFIDLRDNILEILHSFIIIVPHILKHSYGFDAYGEIEKSINDFVNESNRMFDILQKFSKIHMNKEYIPEYYIKPYNAMKTSYYP